jgi:NAD+ kinase
MGRRIALFAHKGRPEAVAAADDLLRRLTEKGIDAAEWSDDSPADLMVVLGGDGTILKAAYDMRGSATPLLGVNLGHVGFLAEAERSDIDAVVDAIADGSYVVEERMAIELHGLDQPAWALNEFSVSKAESSLVDLLVEIDGRPVSRWGCDGIIVSTPTGSTAYAFSAGGSIIWPGVEAMTVVPVAAHALFDRPLVVGPHSEISLTLLSGSGMVTADGYRHQVLPLERRVTVKPAAVPVLLARLTASPFTDRLVAKFRLPIDGWRGVV